MIAHVPPDIPPLWVVVATAIDELPEQAVTQVVVTERLPVALLFTVELLLGCRLV